jgi:hypothetical protein
MQRATVRGCGYFYSGPKSTRKYLYSLFWNHIVMKTRFLHVLTPCIQKPENKRAVPDRSTHAYAGHSLAGLDPERRVYFLVFECKGSVHVKTVFSQQCGSRKGCTGTSGYFWAPRPVLLIVSSAPRWRAAGEGLLASVAYFTFVSAAAGHSIARCTVQTFGCVGSEHG